MFATAGRHSLHTVSTHQWVAMHLVTPILYLKDSGMRTDKRERQCACRGDGVSARAWHSAETVDNV